MPVWPVPGVAHRRHKTLSKLPLICRREQRPAEEYRYVATVAFAGPSNLACARPIPE